MADQDIRPALSPEEWANARRFPPGVVYGFAESDGTMDRHKLAAICLHGQPFGFSHEDLKAIEYGISGIRNNHWERCGGEPLKCPSCGPEIKALTAIAAKISALLPPPETPV